MPAANTRRGPVLQWVIVLFVGIVVVTLVLGLNLIARLDDGQDILNAAKPVFVTRRLDADIAGINLISKNVNMAEPIVTPAGGGAGEVPAVVAFVAAANHGSTTQALAFLEKHFPHTTKLLEAIPLTSVSAELPHFVTFLAKTLKLTSIELVAALHTDFPALLQTITDLPKVTSGWDDVPGLAQDGLTDFNGPPVRTVPHLRNYFANLIGLVARQKSNFDSLNSTSLNWIAWVVLAIGVIVILFALGMIALSRRGITRRVALASASVVVAVGVVVVALVLALNLLPRLSNGQKLIDALNPAFTVSRVKADRAGIDMVAEIVAAENPIMTPSGGAAAEVPKLVALVSAKTKLSGPAVLALLEKDFPAVTAILEAIPLTSVSAEVPAVAKALKPALPRVPRLRETLDNAPPVTSGWNDVPGTLGATNFQGGPINTVPQLAAYFSADLIPVLETQRRHWETLTSTSKINFIGWLVLAIGAIAIVYGVLMVLLARTRPAT